MDPQQTLSLENPQQEAPIEENNNNNNQEISQIPFASLSLSLSPSSLLPLSTHPKQKPPLSSFTTNLKIPSQISSISLSTSPQNPTISNKAHSRKTPSNLISPTTLISPFLRRLPSDPSYGAAARRTAVVWLRSDLRLHDNEALTTASNESVSVLPIFLFDPRDFGKSSSGFDKTGPYRAQFLIQCVSDLRSSLRSRGSDLVVRIGKPETVLVELAKAVGADAVYAHREVSNDEVKAEQRVEKAMEEEGIAMKYFWGSTLYHLEDLPFDLEKMPTNYGGFREKVKGVGVRKTIEALDAVKGLPVQGDVEVGEVPTLLDLGLNPPRDGKASASASLVGGETEALERLKKFAAECHAPPKTKSKDGAQDSIFGANFSCKISPWLATGCLSPRFMYEELKKNATRSISASTQKNGGAAADSGMNWLMFELLWRDFFRFITKKYSSNKRKTETVPGTACTPAFA